MKAIALGLIFSLPAVAQAAAPVASTADFWTTIIVTLVGQVILLLAAIKVFRTPPTAIAAVATAAVAPLIKASDEVRDTSLEVIRRDVNQNYNAMREALALANQQIAHLTADALRVARESPVLPAPPGATPQPVEVVNPVVPVTVVPEP